MLGRPIIIIIVVSGQAPLPVEPLGFRQIKRSVFPQLMSVKGAHIVGLAMNRLSHFDTAALNQPAEYTVLYRRFETY